MHVDIYIYIFICIYTCKYIFLSLQSITCRSGTTEPTPKAKAKARGKAKAKAKSMPGAAVVEEGAKTLDQVKVEVSNLSATGG